MKRSGRPLKPIPALASVESVMPSQRLPAPQAGDRAKVTVRRNLNGPRLHRRAGEENVHQRQMTACRPIQCPRQFRHLLPEARRGGNLRDDVKTARHFRFSLKGICFRGSALGKREWGMGRWGGQGSGGREGDVGARMRFGECFFGRGIERSGGRGVVWRAWRIWWRKSSVCEQYLLAGFSPSSS